MRFVTEMGCKEKSNQVSFESIITVLGVVYAHRKMVNGGELYLTRHGMQRAHMLELNNWYEPSWFVENREQLHGTSTVYRVPTRPVHGESIDLVIKNCRVGEDVPGDTQTLLKFLNAEFNSPWEEFSLTTELREGKFGDPGVSIKTQDPLAIFIPAENMQPWQSGRSRDRLKRVTARHPGIEIDILKQYKLVYSWIHGNDVEECLVYLGISGDELIHHCSRLSARSIQTLAQKGFIVADMKSSHIIVSETDVHTMKRIHCSGGDGVAFLEHLIDTVQYSIIDYELLDRTPAHDKQVHDERRQIYLDVQRDRFKSAPLPDFLKSTTTMGVPYVFGHSESTDGRLWVVGNNGELFDYFLPERWRCTQSWMLSEDSDIFYTLTKDHIHLVWKISRVGEIPQPNPDAPDAADIIAHGYNSPFEEFAIAMDLMRKGVGTVYVRAIYRTGSIKIMPTTDYSRYRSHEGLMSPDGIPILQSYYNYITLRGFYNGPDEWVASQRSALCRPMDLTKAVQAKHITRNDADELFAKMLSDIHLAGYDGALLREDDFLLAETPEGTLLKTQDGALDIRICNFELIKRRV